MQIFIHFQIRIHNVWKPLNGDIAQRGSCINYQFTSTAKRQEKKSTQVAHFVKYQSETPEQILECSGLRAGNQAKLWCGFSSYSMFSVSSSPSMAPLGWLQLTSCDFRLSGKKDKRSKNKDILILIA